MKTSFRPTFLLAPLVAAATFCCASPKQSESETADSKDPIESVASVESSSNVPFFQLPGYAVGTDETPGKHVMTVFMAPG